MPDIKENEVLTWEKLRPFKTAITTPKFPIHCLPNVLRDYSLAIAEHTQTPIDMSAVASLGVSSACLQGKYLVQGKIGHNEPINNYYLEVAKPGERKSSVCSIFEEPIRTYEKRKNESLALEIAQSANVRQVLEREMDDLKNSVAKRKKSYVEMEEKQAEINNHKDVKPIRLICGDVTPEALTSLLADNNGKMALFSAEGGIFDTLKGMYSQVTNIDTFLKAHCGDSIRVDRKGRQAEFIEKPSLTTLLFIQPNVLYELIANETFRGRGLTARFLFSYPQSTVGSRRYKTQPVPEDISRKYHQLCEDMLNINHAEPKLLILSNEAEAISEGFYNALEPRLGKDGDLEHMADWAGKLHGAVLRIAGLLHAVEGISAMGKDFADIPFSDVLVITGKTMESAVAIGQYFLSYTIICYGTSGVSEAERGAIYILERLKKHRPVQFTTGELLRLCTKFKSVKDIAEPLSLLAERGYIQEYKPEYKGTGRQPGLIYKINPATYEDSET